MLKIKVTAITPVTDLGYIRRRIEALGFNTEQFGKELIVTQGLHQFVSDGFRLAEFLKNNNGLVKYDHCDDNEKKWRTQDELVKHSDTLTNEAIRNEDPT